MVLYVNGKWKYFVSYEWFIDFHDQNNVFMYVWSSDFMTPLEVEVK